MSKIGLSGAILGSPDIIFLSEVNALNPKAASEAVGEKEAFNSFSNSISAPVKRLKFGVFTSGEKSNKDGVAPIFPAPLNLLLEGTFNEDKFFGFTHVSEPLKGDNPDAFACKLFKLFLVVRVGDTGFTAAIFPFASTLAATFLLCTAAVVVGCLVGNGAVCFFDTGAGVFFSDFF